MASALIPIITFVFVIGVLVFFHEGGHFSIAKLFKVKVEVFSLGFGPRLFGFKRGETDYRVSGIPLGGYVKMLGENPDEIEDAKDLEGSLISKPGWQRFLIFVAGPAANILLAILIPAMVYMFQFPILAYRSEPARVGYIVKDSVAAKAGIQEGDLILKFHNIDSPTWEQVEDQTALRPGQSIHVLVDRAGQRLDLVLDVDTEKHSVGDLGVSGLLPEIPVRVGKVEDGLPAAKAGLRAGDIIAKINGESIGNMKELQDFVRGNVGRQLDITVLRNGQNIEMKVTPFQDKGLGYGRIGFGEEPKVVMSKLGPIQAVTESVDYNVHNISMMKEAFGDVIQGKRSVKDTFSGPVGIASVSGQAAQQGASSLFMLMAMLSLSLGIFNLLPIPVLDGGQVMMLVLEKGFNFFGGELTVALREKIQTAGFAVIVLLMGYIIYADIAKLIQ